MFSFGYKYVYLQVIFKCSQILIHVYKAKKIIK